MTSRINNSRLERTPRNSNSNGFYDPPSSSFSSTLLDAIYRSIDETRHISPQHQRKKQEPDLDFLPELSSLKKQQQRIVSGSYDIGGAKNNAAGAASTMMTKSSSAYNDRDWKVRGSSTAGGSRARLVDRWMDHPSSAEEISGGDMIRSQQRRSDRRFSLGSVESISSSSDDTEPFYHNCAAPPEDKKKKQQQQQKPLKPIRTSISVPFLDAETLRPPKQRFASSDGGAGEKPRGTKSHHRLLQEPLRAAAEKGEGGKAATAKSRALKFYGDLKRMKQPISPGGRLATFLNSLFSGAGGGGGGGGGGGSAKKQRTSTSSSSASAGERTFAESGRWERESTSKSSSLLSTATTPTCSTASTSSLSRSCLSSKTSTASSASSTTTGEKRSVRFCPVSVIIDEDLRPCGHKSLNEEFGGTELRARVVEENRRVEEAARDLLKNYHHHGINHHQKKLREIIDAVKEEEEGEDDEEEDGMSCCSSDLFELENLMEIGRHYCEELPVYETTYVDTNRAIASGLVV